MDIKELDNRNNLGEFLNRNGLFGFGAEVGVLYASNATRILSTWRGTTLFCVDPWKTQPKEDYIDGAATVDFDAAFFEALNKLSKFPGRFSMVRKTSDEAALMIPDGMLDFVYLDGNHHDPQISRDLSTWWPKVKAGGVFGGHDYYNLDEPWYKCDVKSAVDAFAAKRGLRLHTTVSDEADKSWWIEKK